MKIGQTFNPRGMFKGLFMPEALNADKRLTTADKLCWAAIFKHLGDNPRAWPGIRTIAKETGLSQKQVTRSMKKLDELGYIEKSVPTGTDRLRHKTTRYALLWHKTFEEAMIRHVPSDGDLMSPPAATSDHPRRGPDVTSNVIDSEERETEKESTPCNPPQGDGVDHSTTSKAMLKGQRKPNKKNPVAVDKDLLEKMETIMEHHREVMATEGKPRSWKLTNGIKRLLKARLNTFSEEELKQAATNLSYSDFHRGTNDNDKEYCDPQFLYRNDEKVDKWLNERSHRKVRKGGAFIPATETRDLPLPEVIDGTDPKAVEKFLRRGKER